MNVKTKVPSNLIAPNRQVFDELYINSVEHGGGNYLMKSMGHEE